MNSISGLFDDAKDAGLVSQASFTTLNAPDVGMMIQQGLGVDADLFDANEAFAQLALLDDSGSIAAAGNEDLLRQGANGMLEALNESQAREDIIISMLTLNRGFVYPFTPLAAAPRLDGNNYRAYGFTPLYDATIVAAGLLLAKEMEFANIGAQMRGSLLVVSDGKDEGSRATARDAKKVIDDLLRREIFIVMFMGINDGQTDFEAVAKSMGIPDQWVLTPANTASEIRQAFGTASRASKTASQGAASFSKMAGGGFGAVV